MIAQISGIHQISDLPTLRETLARYKSNFDAEMGIIGADDAVDIFQVVRKLSRPCL